MPILASKFFNRDTIQVARDLLGKVLVRSSGEKILETIINEVEVYDGFEDRASHAHRGMTQRNKPMFGPAGRWYIYLIYGLHSMLNITTGPNKYPAAILIRGGFKADGKNINGPGKLTKYLKIDKSLNDLRGSRKSGLWVEDRGIKIKQGDILVSPRIGVAYAGEWAHKPYNFKIKNPRDISRG